MELVAWERRINSKLSAIQRAGCASVTYKDRFALILGGRSFDTFYLDCWSYDTSSGAINELSSGLKNCSPRVYHSATLIDGVVWVIGGSNGETIHGDVWCFDVKTRVWTQPKLRGDRNLLRRTAHGACLHPTMPGCILLFGGYGVTSSDQTSEWLSDLVVVNTRTDTVEPVKPRGKVPLHRAYHSFTAVGNLCVALFGRMGNKGLVPAKNSVAIYDALAGSWIEIPDKDIKGTMPQVRSSHRACSVNATTSGTGIDVGGGSSGILFFGGAPALLASKKPERLTDLNYLKICIAPQVSSRSRNGSGGSGLRYQLEWIECGNGNGEAGNEVEGGTWPNGRAAHAQEFINGKLCLVGGYCRHEKYCTDVWEGLVVVEGQEPGGRGGGAGVGAKTRLPAVCNDPTALPVDIAPKWKSTRARREPDNIPQNILPAKRQRAAAGVGGAIAKPTKTVPAVQAGSKRTKKEYVEEIVVVDEPNTISPEVVPGSRRIAALEKEIKALQDALVAQRAKEAALLREANTAKSDVFKLRNELNKVDENWRRTAAERDDWKFKFNDQQRVATQAVAAKKLAVDEATAAEQRCQEAVRRSQANNTIANQKQQALEAAAAENTQLRSTVSALQGALDQATAATDKERQLRISIQEQNSVLRGKISTAEVDTSELQRQLKLARSSLESNKLQWEGEQARLQRELSTAKADLTAAQRDLEAEKRKESKLESEIATLQDKNSTLQSKVLRLECDLKNVEQEMQRAEGEKKKLKDDLHDLQRAFDSKQQSIDGELNEILRHVQRTRDTNAASSSRR